MARYGKKAASDLAKLGNDTARFSAEDRLQLCRELATYLWETGDLEDAKQIAGQACDAAPTNLAVRLLLFDLTYFSRDLSGMERMLGEIKSFQGEGPLWHYGEAVRLAVLAERQPKNTQVTQEQAGLLQQSLAHLVKALDMHAAWGPALLSEARIYDRLGQIDPAIENYCKAIDAGEVAPATVRRAFELLYNRQRYAEADDMLRRLEQEQATFISDLGRKASEVSWHLENFDRAQELARQTAEQSKDWADHLWLGELQAFLGRRALADQFPKEARARFLDAEKSLRRAVELGPEVPEAWVGLYPLPGVNRSEGGGPGPTG